MDDYLTTEEACKYIKVSSKTIKRYMQDDILISGLHYFKPRGKLLFKKSKLAKWIEGETKNSKVVNDILATI